MKKIKYTQHLLNRIKLRKISKKLVESILKFPNSTFEDSLNKTKIAIGLKNSHYYMVAYIDEQNEIKIITTHPIKKSQIKNRIKTKRWIKIQS